MKNIEKVISPLIESQFPTFYREEGPNFVAFVKAYYEWLESEDNPLYHARRIPDYKDIDTTLDDFILYFKEKYLKNIQFDIASNKKLLIKNSLDLYRSKGSERSIDLFFKLVYGTEADVKYPKDNLFKLSSGDWEKPQYLEVTDSSRNVDYVGKLITGTLSNATAFVEKFIRRKTATGYVSILQISDIKGSFKNNEKIGITVNGNLISYDDSPYLIGSLNRVIIQDGSVGFKVGDLVNVQSSYQGVGGLARVTAVANATGAVDFLFLDGGWGYTNTSSLSIVSEKVLILSGVRANVQSGEYFSLFEKLVEPIVSVTVDNALDNIPVGTFVYRVDASNNVVATAQVVTSNIADDSTGDLLLSLKSGSLIASGNTYYANLYSGNTQVTFDILQATDRTITGRVMGIPSRYEMSITDQYGTLEVGDTLFQADKVQTYGTGTVVSVSSIPGGSIVVLDNATGAFRDSHETYVVSSDTEQFNGNTAVNAASYAITLNTHNFKQDDLILYRTSAGNTAISGLANNGTYFVINETPSTIQLSRIKGGPAIPLIPSSTVGSTGHFIIGNNLNIEYARIAANSLSIDAANKFIKIPSNDFELGETVYYTTDAGNTAIGGMSNGTHYFVTSANSTGIQISEMYNGTPITLTPGANETGHNLLARAHISALNSAGVKKVNFTADFGSVGFNLGVYDIKKEIFNLGFVSATSNALYDAAYVYHYNEDNIEIARGRVVTVEMSGTDGFMTVIPLSGYFIEGRTLYAEGNTASAVIAESTSTVKGGDYVLSDYSTAVSLLNDTSITISRASYGSGAQFSVGAIGENESIYINTDLLNANAQIYVNNERADLTIVNTSGFTPGDTVFQLETVSFSSNSSGISNVDFITTAGANPFVNGDVVQYSSNTTPLQYQVTPWAGASTITESFANGDQFFVVSANTTGFKISHQREGTGYLDLVEETPGSNGHFFSKVTAGGTIVSANTTHVKITDLYKQFNTTAGNYGPLTSYTNTALSANITSIGTMPTLVVPQRQYPVERIRSAAFGFPKNPQGDLESTIYSCLTFDKFDIGTIGGIYAVDPGSQYNIDPFVIVYQPYIAAFDRKDYIFKISNLSSPLVVGEKISQTPTSLTFYDLQVSGGVKDATYNEITKNLDASIDIDGSTDFIYVPYIEFTIDANTEIDSLSVHFNSSFDVDPVSKEILFDVVPFLDGDAIVYTTTGSAIGGLSNNTTYYVLNVSGTGIQLAANSTSTTPINLTRTATNETHILAKAVNNFITIPSNVLANNMLVRYYTETGYDVAPGLANGSLYLVANASSFGFFLANTANTAQIISVNASNTVGTHHRIRSYYNGETSNSLYFADNDLMLYNIYDGGSNVGLSNATSYFVVSANTVGFKLANSPNGAPIDLTPSATSETDHYISTVPGFLPGDIVYQNITSAFDAQTNVNALTDFIAIDNHPYKDGDVVLYYTGNGHTSITGANNVLYDVTQANSTGLKLASNGTLVQLTAVGNTQFHNLKSTPTGVVASVFQGNNASYVRVSNVTSTFTTSYELLSQSFEIITGTTVLDVNQYAQLVTAQGIVKAIVDSETILVKRIEFENTFVPGEIVTGQFTGATATLISVAEDESSTPIGVNAVVEANVVTANGVITNLQVIDSGLGYANSEIVQYTSLDGTKSGTGKTVIDGHGTSKGYYKSSKGFLSADMKIHDGDYYQEYSYEVLSKISFDRYSDMFKKVMHVAGTKLFGSAMIIENADVNADVIDIQTDQIIEFNARTDIDTLTDTIQTGTPKIVRSINPSAIAENRRAIYMPAQPFTYGDVVTYNTSPGNTVISGLANNGSYYVLDTAAHFFSLSTTLGGNPINILPGAYERGHYFTQYKNDLATGDIVEYYPEHRAFNKKSDINVEEDFIYLQQHNFNDGDRVRYVSVDNASVNGLTNNALYYVAESNTSGVKLTNGEKSIAAVFKYDAATKDLVIHLIDSRSYSNVNLVANTFGSLSTQTITTRGGEVRIHGSGYTLVANNYQAAIYQGNTNVQEDILFSYNEDALPSGPVGNVSVVFVGSQYFNRYGYGNVTRYSFIDDVVDIYAEWPTRVDYHITDHSYEDMIPAEDQGFVVDLLQPIARFGQSNINFATDFITIKNINSQTNTPVFANNDIIRYDAAFRNVPIKNLFIGDDYYVVQANTTGFKVATTANGTPIDLYKDVANVNSVSDISDEYNFIIIRDNEFVIDDPVKYVQANNTRTITGLSNNTTYYVVYANNVGIKLSTTQRGPVANVGPANTFSYAFDGFANVANTTNFISSANHSFQDLDAVTYTTANRISPIGGLVNNAVYYVTFANTSGFKLSSTANGSTVVSLTSTKTRLSEFDATTAVDSVNDFIAIPSHSYISGEAVKYYTSASANTIGGLANNTNYFVVEANTSGIKLSNSATGAAIDITAPVGSGNTFIESLQANGHALAMISTANTAQFERQLSSNGYTFTLINNDNGSGHILFGKDLLSGFELNERFYVANTTSKTIQLANTANGNPIDIPIGLNETGHYLKKIIED